jgi:3-oxoacyl-[acyl-carrier protein] reductase
MANDRKTALITGAGQNIGKACALALARNGFNIVINGRSKREQCDDVADQVQRMGPDTLVAIGDVGSREGCEAVVKPALERFGRIDVMVHNAALRPSSPFLEMNEDDWHHILNVNMNASFWLARLTLPGMVEAGWGRIVNFAGMNAMHGYNGRAHVSTSKHGNWGLTKALAKEFGPKGITVNLVSPGPIRPENDDPDQMAHHGEQLARIPVGRLGEPTEVAAVVALLASDEGAFINGQMIQVNGGMMT